jgi:NADH-quinone oxidoreductase subunit C
MKVPVDFPALVRGEIQIFEAELAGDSRGELRVSVSAADALACLTRLQNEPSLALRRLVDLTAIDRGRDGSRDDDRNRFELVYRLHSPSLNQRLRVHVGIEFPRPGLDSVISLWPNANWLEREVFDLFGIEFRGHPGLQRILLEADFEGAPLRKDYLRQPDLDLPKEVAS